MRDSARYNPEVGDLIVGRITEVRSDCPLIQQEDYRHHLGATTPMESGRKLTAGRRPDALVRQPSRRSTGTCLKEHIVTNTDIINPCQRRKVEADELQMRTFFEEGDLLVAEVQAFFADGAMSLHTRSLRYGKVCLPLAMYFVPLLIMLFQLRNGQLVIVPPILIRRLKSHFVSLPCGVDLILGLNGYIWVSKHVKQNEQEGEEGFDSEAVYSNKNDVSVAHAIFYASLPYLTQNAIHRTSTTIRAQRFRVSVTSSRCSQPSLSRCRTLCCSRPTNGLSSKKQV